MPTIARIAISAAKLPTVAVRAPSTPCSAQVSQSSRVERVADEAAVAGLVGLPAAEEPDLALELHGGGGHQGNAKPSERVADNKPGREIVAAVDDEVVARQQRFCILAGKPALGGQNLDVRIEARTKLAANFGFGLPDLIVAEDRLTLQIGPVDDVIVDDRQAPDARSGERRDCRASDTPGSDNGDAGRLQLALPDASELRQDDVPGVALQLVVAEIGHCPVLPNPPLPRSVSASSCTSAKWA